MHANRAAYFPLWRVPCAALLAVAVLVLPVSRAADPQPYSVTLDKTGDDAIDKALTDSSLLISLAENAPAGPFALEARSRKDVERFIAALQSFGYYKAKVQVSFENLPLDDPGLGRLLERAPANPPLKVKVAIDKGPQFHLRNVEIQGLADERAKGWLALDSGAPAIASQVLAARERLLESLRSEGHALAKVDEPIATLAPDADALDVTYRAEAGPLALLGRISINGLERVDEAFVRRRLQVAYGDLFNPVSIEKARLDLASSGVFSSVRVQLGEKLDEQGRLPIEFIFTERARRAANVGAAFSTDIGGSITTGWQHRNLFGEAEQLNLTAGVTQLGGNSTTGIGYKGVAEFVKPDIWQRDQSLHANLGAVKQSLIAYDEKSVLGGLTLNRKFANHWKAGVGFAGEQSEITQEGIRRNYTLLSLPLTLRYDSSNNLLDPTQGIRAEASLTPVYPLVAARTTTFVLMQVSGSSYLDLGEPGRSVLAFRGMVGDAQGASQFDLPPDKRFYAGGSATVRGYNYQSIGPKFPNNKPQGGTAMAAATAEFRQRILDSYGAVAFADVGQVSANGAPFMGIWRLGVGVGARYYTSFGPIRVDVALPATKEPGSGSFQVYIGLGQAF